ncbi:MAG TPA: hypothetical protein VMQ58_01960 [Candidatus Saccharimonadales bacterium]|nr:hypothetical protein [Candidatus Saccharimonadales bacterium]
MGTTVGLGRTVMIYVCICVLLYMGGVRVSGNGNMPSNPSVDFTINNLVDTSNISSGQLGNGLGIQTSVDKNLQKTTGGLFNFVDALQSISGFVIFIFNIVFAPIGLFTATGMPWQISMIIGVPLMVMLWLGFAYFIRSGA